MQEASKRLKAMNKNRTKTFDSPLASHLLPLAGRAHNS